MDRLQYLLEQLFHHRLTEEERDELALWADTLRNDEEWKERLSNIWNSYQPVEKMNSKQADDILKNILAEGKKKSPEKITRPSYTPIHHGIMRWAVVAAAAIGVLIILSLIFLNPEREISSKKMTRQETSQKQGIVPGGNKAILTLANGKRILLDSSGTGTLAQQGDTRIIKVDSGVLAYNQQSGTGRQEAGASFNTITTPRGGQYQIILPDGSKIWLNSASSMKFPTAFTGNERAISIKGEVYLEVKEDAHAPFVVHIQSQEGQDKGTVKVLGTHFNINAYTDTAMTTLVKGAVKIVVRGKEQKLKPGQQAVVEGNEIKINEKVNLNEIIAWKNGLFDFEGNSIEEVMRQIAQWYDVEVKYKEAPSAHFMGSISRSANISEVLKMLEMTGAVHFRIEGRTVVVMK